MSRSSIALLLITLLTSCTEYNPGWTPVVDAANDPNADRLKSDTDQCRQLALRVGEQNASPLSRTTFMTDDGEFVSKATYQHAFTACLKERKHPVLN